MQGISQFFISEYLAYVAGGFYVAGLVIINQVVLRVFILVGTAVYVVYYAIIASQPLWEAIYVSAFIGAANVIGLTTLLARRSRLAVPRAHADIYHNFPHLPPGDFRALMKLAHRHTIESDRQVTTEGATGTRLYYIVSGAALVRKGDHAFALPPNLFLGEIAFLLKVPSSASVWLEEGAEVLEWSFTDLRRKCARSPRFQLALEAAISVDLAGKVASSMGRHAVKLEEIPEPVIEALQKARAY